MKKVIFDLRHISFEELEGDLCLLMDGNYTPQLEILLASYAGKIVQVQFSEVRSKKVRI